MKLDPLMNHSEASSIYETRSLDEHSEASSIYETRSLDEL